MKKLLFIALLLLPIAGFSQTKTIDGFLGIKFGSSKDDVIASMKAKGATPEKNNDNSENRLAFDKVKLGHRESIGLIVKFFDNKAYEAVFIFKAEEDPKTIEYYNALVSDINEVYGPGKQNRIFRTTFTDGDGYEITAIETGNADYFTNWKSDNSNTIQAMINSKFNIFLFYTDGVIDAEVKKQEKAKEKGDF